MIRMLPTSFQKVKSNPGGVLENKSSWNSKMLKIFDENLDKNCEKYLLGRSFLIKLQVSCSFLTKDEIICVFISSVSLYSSQYGCLCPLYFLFIL